MIIYIYIFIINFILINIIYTYLTEIKYSNLDNFFIYYIYIIDIIFFNLLFF